MVAHISAETAHYLVEQYPIDFVFIDVRRKDELANFGSIEYSFNLPIEEWDTAFALQENEFAQKYNFSKPKLSDNLVLISRTSERRAVSAAAKAAELGYKRVAVVKGGIQEYSLYDTKDKFYDSYSEGQPPPPVSTLKIAKKETSFPWITTDELHKMSEDELITLDLRRKDEIDQFGAYPKSLNLPTEECIRAIQIKDGDWIKEYGFPRPHPGKPILLYCRSNRRAKYVYQLFKDAGWENEGIKMLVFKDGVAGLSRLSPHVKAYDSYEENDPFPPVISPENPL